MTDEQRERVALVALLLRPRARWSEVTAEVLDSGSAVAVARQHAGAEETLFGDDQALDAELAAAARQMARWQADGIGVHTMLEAEYPAPLRDVRQMPPLIFTRGRLADDTRSVAVVGTRRPTDRGRALAQTIATALAEQRVTVVSGLAQGIDAAAHDGALRAGGRTVAVVGTGINRVYPASNRTLQEQIVDRGLVLSQFLPDAPPSKKSFPMRNAVMSGYAAATIVVEAGEISGARIQARFALEHGRPLILSSQVLEHQWARDYAERPSTFVVGSTSELLDAVGQVLRQIPSGMDAWEGLPSLEPA